MAIIWAVSQMSVPLNRSRADFPGRCGAVSGAFPDNVRRVSPAVIGKVEAIG
jgi:hypothetical protein